MTRTQSFSAYGYITAAGIALAAIAAWGTHVITCINEGQWLLLIAGAIVFPVGIVHGVGIWLGFWH